MILVLNHSFFVCGKIRVKDGYIKFQNSSEILSSDSLHFVTLILLIQNEKRNHQKPKRLYIILILV